MITPEQVLDYWFSDATESPEKAAARGDFWFKSNPAVDVEIDERFRSVLDAAAEHELDHWLATPKGRLAMIIVLDQFPRNIFRGTEEAFAYDGDALTIMLQGLNVDVPEHLQPVEQAFYLMPTQHAEDIEIQRMGVSQYEACAGNAPEAWAAHMKGYTDFARQHLEIIEKFGRFPHRNSILSRISTEEETAYLNDGGATFGQ